MGRLLLLCRREKLGSATGEERMIMVAPKRNVAGVVTLFLVAPLVAEYLLGDLPIQMLPLLILQAPMYGGGALLIREMARRRGKGWPTMLLLAAAYALIEEGFATQSLFNHDFLKLQRHWLDAAYIPALGIGGWWTLISLNAHVFWSMGASIALAEGLFPEEADAPWMGRIGDSVVALVFVAGVAANAAVQLRRDSFVASHAQFVWTAVVCALLVLAALLTPSYIVDRTSGAVPAPWVIGLGVFFLGMVDLLTSPGLGWGAFAILLGVDVVFLVLLQLLSRRDGWTAMHTFSVAAGGMMTYGLHAFIQAPAIPGSMIVVRVGNAIFLAAAIGLIVVGVKRVSGLTAGRAAATLEV